MHTTKLRTTITALAAVGMLSLTGATGASAATKATRQVTPPASTGGQQFDGRGAARIRAGATGQGVSQSYCDLYADYINAYVNSGSYMEASIAADQAMDHGCFLYSE